MENWRKQRIKTDTHYIFHRTINGVLEIKYIRYN